MAKVESFHGKLKYQQPTILLKVHFIMSAAELLENSSVSFQTDILVSLSDHSGTQKDSNYE